MTTRRPILYDHPCNEDALLYLVAGAVFLGVVVMAFCSSVLAIRDIAPGAAAAVFGAASLSALASSFIGMSASVDRRVGPAVAGFFAMLIAVLLAVLSWPQF